MKNLKKYANRRIYDSEAREFVKLTEIWQMVIDRTAFRVVDAENGKDITRGILMQLITEMEAEGHESLLTNRVLEELIRFYDDKLVALLSPYIEQQILNSLAISDDLRGCVAKAFTNPYLSADEMAKRLFEPYEKLARAVSGQASAPSKSRDQGGE